ncbi:hypothetical protein H6F90_16740 [Trichocoleus sp. FACHB-591]|uniref:hypothetical protein n=1 Tax=Trichocoleus sp. FACHB-591 TaxID=2692872 RepID=UPI00168611C9|nr:hypothetical protein [Trichocoleus sp. FACHB-591]MBD2096752.1 hypothetical protein [Trichocoleus sp. FACHB-591]
MVKIAEQHPETREQSIAAITHQLGQFTKNNPVLNGMLVVALLDLKAVEAAPVMERAFLQIEWMKRSRAIGRRCS